MMGSAEGEEGHRPNESPQHGVRISQPFAVMEAEVTREAFERFVKDTAYEVGESCHTRYENGARSNVKRDWLRPGFEQGPNHPVVCVDWNGATAFAEWLTKRTGQTYRLLTEAEWEYAARARTRSSYHFGDQSSDLCRYANVIDRSEKKVDSRLVAANCEDGYVNTAPVKTYLPNAFGLYDMSGNAWEWVLDCWHDNYRGAPEEDAGKPWEMNCSEDSRVLRGGGWNSAIGSARSAFRYRLPPDVGDNFIGFRLARVLKSLSSKP